MTVSSVRAKHRSARRPGAALSVITQAAEQMTSVGRRTAVVAASSGLLVSMIGAAPASGVTQESVALDKSKTLDVQGSSFTSSANTINVPADATFVIETSAVTVTPAPKPEPEPVRQTRASRDADRVAAQTAPQEQAAPQQEATRVAAPASVDGNEVISIAARYIGVPYVYGGTTPDGFDCSGFTAYVFAQLGISLPHSSKAQSQLGTRVSREEARPGDLVWTPGHIAIYAGDGMIIDASRPGEVVDFRKMWQSNPTFIRVN